MSSNERLTLFSFEIWCSLGDEELSRSKSENLTYSLKEGGLEVSQKSMKKSHKFFQALFDQLFDVCINYINIENENEEEENETDEIKELDEEYEEGEYEEDEERENEDEEEENDDIEQDDNDEMINRIIKITEKEILKNKEKLDEQSKKNSAITVILNE